MFLSSVSSFLSFLVCGSIFDFRAALSRIFRLFAHYQMDILCHHLLPHSTQYTQCNILPGRHIIDNNHKRGKGKTLAICLGLVKKHVQLGFDSVIFLIVAVVSG